MTSAIKMFSASLTSGPALCVINITLKINYMLSRSKPLFIFIPQFLKPCRVLLLTFGKGEYRAQAGFRAVLFRSQTADLCKMRGQQPFTFEQFDLFRDLLCCFIDDAKGLISVGFHGLVFPCREITYQLYVV